MGSINVSHVSMSFNMSKDKINSIKEYVIKLAKKQLFYEEFKALDDISFSINKGEVFGIIGKNGAGKSTLLKLIAGVLKPSQGSIEISGSIAPLIELGAGFDPELTARENIFLNGAMLGYSKKYLREKFDEIVDFSELHNFLDVPVKNYSSGMYARLGFAIATLVEPEILIVDEILSVGDYQFQQKCERKIQAMIEKGTTVIMVSHSLDQVQELCSRILWLEHGRIRSIGDSATICEQFKNS
ncbi:ABC transporter ATP-binding protein [Paenibacillus sp. DMB5]|uniref:ABC transporter ATP-binding protein n=1 Tax=Paenibacillus sp. DMB5 TaxID=1780103 RepID=UPI00076CB035|nr:ABC transporter ATP-binding protein [Paenibacillus sp. DMB5]KUP23923.1 teichoic acid ABC transporter ATP-binding protein [Paenibacillus sp. DMB5]